MPSKRISRREFLRLSGLGAAAVIGGRLAVQDWARGSDVFQAGPTPAMSQHQMGPQPAGTFVPDAEVSITAKEKTVQLLPGASTRVMAYEGELLSGSGVTVGAVPNSYLGPVMRVKTGTKIRLTLHNELAEKTVIHPHGLRVPDYCDGDPMQSIDPGQTKVYEFQVIDRAGPYWFHPHPMMRTAEQVYMGLAGLFTVWDDEEERAVPGASTGENDIPVIIQDRIFDSANQFAYQPNMMWGMLGNRFLVNGTVDARCGLEPRAYRLRILNGSNARTYKLAWSNGMPLLAVGSDGGLLPAPLSRSYITLMPGERVDVWADFTSLAGQSVVLKSLPFDSPIGMMGGMGMMGGGMMGGMGMGGMRGGFANGTPLDILTVNVGKGPVSSPVLGKLPPLSVRYRPDNLPDFASPHPVILSMGMMMSWLINGRQYETEGLAEDEKVMAGKPLVWEFNNLSPIPHPMHIHNVQFQVIQRSPSTLASYASISQGFIDSGWKDTVLVWPGERVKVAMQFGPHTGMYMYHCHILEHEDMGMMRNLMIME